MCQKLGSKSASKAKLFPILHYYKVLVAKKNVEIKDEIMATTLKAMSNKYRYSRFMQSPNNQQPQQFLSGCSYQYQPVASGFLIDSDDATDQFRFSENHLSLVLCSYAG